MTWLGVNMPVLVAYICLRACDCCIASLLFETWRPASRYNIRVEARMAAGGSCTGPATAEMDQGILDEKAHSPTLLLSVRSQVLNFGICVREYLAA